MDALISQYTDADEDSRLVSQFITKMEYDTTMHVLKQYLSASKSVCEIGAATGRYSLEFAKRGCCVTSVELAPDQVEILKKNASLNNLKLKIYEGNACELPFIKSNSQDLCVILGPLYHLQSKKERQQAIGEANRILKEGGILAIAYISRYFVAGMFAQQFPNLITPEVLQELNQNGTISNPNADNFFRVGYFATPSEIESLLIEQNLNIIKHVATDGFGRYISQGVNNFTPSQYETWLNYHLETCDEKSLLGSSNHGLVLGRKTK